MNFSVGGDELSRINGSLAVHVCRTASGFLDHDSERRKVPRFRSPIERHLDRALRDQHVLPESAERAAVARGVPQSADLRLVLRVLACTRSPRKNHTFAPAG